MLADLADDADDCPLFVISACIRSLEGQPQAIDTLCEKIRVYFGESKNVKVAYLERCLGI